MKKRVKPTGQRQERVPPPPPLRQEGEEREELDFQFDEELDVPSGRHNTFTDWLVFCSPSLSEYNLRNLFYLFGIKT